MWCGDGLDRQPGAREAGFGLDDRVRVVDVDLRGPDREGVVGGEAEDASTLGRAAPGRRVEGRRIGDDPQARGAGQARARWPSGS